MDCVHTNDVWVGTVEAPLRTGKTIGGFQIVADGIDENGNAVNGYVLGVGDYMVLNRDNTEGDTAYLLHLHDETPETPKKADVAKHDGKWRIHNGSEWEPFGGLDYKAGEGLQLSGDTFSISATIPERTSQLINDSGYITGDSIPPATLLYSSLSAITLPAAADRYITGKGEVYKYKFDGVLKLGDKIYERISLTEWCLMWTSSRVEFEIATNRWRFREDVYSPWFYTAGTIDD